MVTNARGGTQKPPGAAESCVARCPLPTASLVVSPSRRVSNPWGNSSPNLPPLHCLQRPSFSPRCCRPAEVKVSSRFTDEEAISGPEASSRHRGLESGSPALEPGPVPRAPQMMCSVEVVSSPSLWAFKFGREVVEGTWASCGVSSSWPLSALSFSGPGGEGHPARTFFPGITSLTVSY